MCVFMVINSYDRLNDIEKGAYLMRQISLHKGARDLCTRASKVPHPTTGEIKAWKIDFNLPSDLPSNACCDYMNRTIHLDPKLSEKMALAMVVFELTNAVSCRKFYDLSHRAFKGLIGCEAYAKGHESIEYEGMKIHRKIMSSTLAKMRWGDEVNCYGEVADCFETYWLNVRPTSHAEYYRKHWSQMPGSGRECVILNGVTCSLRDIEATKRSERIISAVQIGLIALTAYLGWNLLF